MKPAAYRDIPSSSIPVVSLDGNVQVKVIAGTFGGASGPVQGGATDPHYFDVILPPHAAFESSLPADYSAFLYAYEGEAFVGAERQTLPHRAAGLLSEGGGVRIEAGGAGARVLVLAGKPIREPVVQYGPFVMNTRAEIEQAIADYQSGALSRDEIRRVEEAAPRSR
jgi:redox-sensitive bicupin YhaK (pirin superfamily)